MNFLIVSGLSGSGKTIALQALEDMGYYCTDNLPAVLLPDFAKQLMGQGNAQGTHAAVSIDSRNRAFLQRLSEPLEQLRALGINTQILFLEAEQSVLVKRFSTTRRKHPLTNPSTPLLEGIRLEKSLLTPLAAAAARQIDTSATTPHELRGLVRDFAGEVHAGGLSLLFQSFGYKHGTPMDADFVFDVRCLPNPYWNTELRALTGNDAQVIAFLQGRPKVAKMIKDISEFLRSWMRDFEEEHRSYITVAIGCTGGQHRSVYVANQLASRFVDQHLNVQKRHRELL